MQLRLIYIIFGLFLATVGVTGVQRLITEQVIDFEHQATPSNPDIGKTRLYMTAADQLFVRTAGGTDNNIGNVDLASEVTGIAPIANGGTGQSGAVGAFDALAPTTTKGDIVVHNGTDNIRIAIGSNDQVLTADSTEASGVKWAAAAGGGGDVVTTGVSGGEKLCAMNVETDGSSNESINDDGGCVASVSGSGTDVVATFTGSFFSGTPRCGCTALTGTQRACQVEAQSSTSVTVRAFASDTASNEGGGTTVICVGD